MLEQINQIAQNHPEYAIAIAFGFAFIESLPFIGSFFPGMLTMPPIGWLMAKSIIPGPYTFIMILIGAMLGDFAGFYLGYSCRNIAHQKAAEHDKSHWLKAGELFIQRYGPMSIIVGRFIGPFRSSVPLFAGIFNMNALFFTLAALPSVILWAIVHLAPGILVAWFNFDIFAHTQTITNVLLTTLGCALILCSAYAHKLTHMTYLQQIVSTCSRQLGLTESANIPVFRIICLLSTIIIMSITIIGGGFDSINQSVYMFFSTQNSALLKFSLIQNALCYIPLVLLLTVTISILLVNENKESEAIQLLLSVATAFAVCFLIKYIVHYPRPHHIAEFLGNQSLPSGHSCLTTAFILSYLSIKKQSQATLQPIGTTFIILTMTTRVLIGAHWVSDVLLGWMIGYLAYLASSLLTRQLHCNAIINTIRDSSLIVRNELLTGISRRKILICYSILSIIYALVTNKLSIAPYQL